MSRVLPYPLLTASLLIMWLLLNGLSVGHIVLGSIVAIRRIAAMVALQPDKPRLRRWDMIPRLIALVLADVLRSNIEVAGIILRGQRRKVRSGFVMIPLRTARPDWPGDPRLHHHQHARHGMGRISRRQRHACGSMSST